jgi:hypothetical protein
MRYATDRITKTSRLSEQTRKILRKGFAVANSAIHTYMAFKKKDPLNIGLALINTYEAVETLLEKDSLGLEELYQKLGLVRCLPHMQSLIYNTLEEIGTSKEVYESGDNLYSKVIKFIFEEFEATFIVENNSAGALFAKNEEDLIRAFSNEVQRGLGDIIGLKIVRDRGTAGISLSPLDLPMDAYVNTEGEEEFCDIITKFHTKGFNRSSLLAGPPGVGKTLFTAKISQILGGRLLVIDAKALNRATDTELFIDQVVKIVNPIVVFFDDMDKIEKLDMLLGDISQLNTMESGRKRLIVGAVNDLRNIPKSMRRTGRFDETVMFYLPNADQRRATLLCHMQAVGFRLCNDYIKQLVDATENMSRSDLREVILQAFVLPFEKVLPRIEHMKRMNNIPENRFYGNRSVEEEKMLCEDAPFGMTNGTIDALRTAVSKGNLP